MSNTQFAVALFLFIVGIIIRIVRKKFGAEPLTLQEMKDILGKDTR